MASSKKNSNDEDKRSKQVPISEAGEHDLTAEPLQRVIHPEQNRHYELHIEAAAEPTKAASIKKEHAKSSIRNNKEEYKKGKLAVGDHLSESRGIKQKSGLRMPRKVWNFLEWLAVSALIFAVLFFAINFSSYSQLLKNKLEK